MASNPFQIREILTVCGQNVENSVKIMSYNVLAQALVRRDQYPTNGNAVKWAKRKVGFEFEFQAYKPDIVFLQEVDEASQPFWRTLLRASGLQVDFQQHRAKRHGLAIAWNDARWTKVNRQTLIYDEIETRAPRQCNTDNIGLLVELAAVESAVPAAAAPALILGTTHMYWHPAASYERSRQLLCLIKAAQNMQETHAGSIAPVVLGGDFNTESFDPAYLLACGEALTDAAAEIMKKSIAAKEFGPAKPVFIPGVTAEPEALAAARAPARVNPTLLDSEHAERLLHDEYARLHVICRSMYRQGYPTVDASNCQDNGEPLFTNWTDDFRATLDYIFYFSPKSPQPARAATSTQSAGKDPQVLKLLKLPAAGDMGPEPSSLPRFGLYPSDHLAIMAEAYWPE